LRQKAEVLNVPAKTASEDAAAEELTTKTELDRLNALKVLADNILTKIKAARDLSKTRVTEKKGVEDNAKLVYTNAEAAYVAKKAIKDGTCTTV
jgi:hypothetical protein